MVQTLLIYSFLILATSAVNLPTVKWRQEGIKTQRHCTNSKITLSHQENHYYRTKIESIILQNQNSNEQKNKNKMIKNLLF